MQAQSITTQNRVNSLMGQIRDAWETLSRGRDYLHQFLGAVDSSSTSKAGHKDNLMVVQEERQLEVGLGLVRSTAVKLRINL